VTELAKKQCVPCRGGIPSLTAPEIQPLLAQIHDWQVIDTHHLEKNFSFENFAEALDFVNRLGTVAESQNHHPDLYLAWGKVGIKLWTHKIDGLSESDFIFAAKIDMVFKGMMAQLGRKS
jgi:4a-hydroxytetrahydrobiopterin dehydratase